MELLRRSFGGLFDVLLAIFGGLSPALSLVLISLLLGVLLLFMFKWIGDPVALERNKDRMIAHLMELRLFDSEPRLVFQAIGRLFYWNGRFVLSTLRPAIVASLPMIFLFIQMEHYYGMRPLRPGETALLSAKFHGAPPKDIGLGSATPDTVAVETPPAQSARGSIVSWRIRAVSEGDGAVELTLGDARVRKSVTVRQSPTQVSQRRVFGTNDHLLHPVEPALPLASVAWIQVNYPKTDITLLGLATHWLVWLFLVSVFGALAVRWFVNRFYPGVL